MKCDGTCNRDIHPTTDLHYISIEGWEQLRSDGGQNAVRDKVRTGKVICDKCLRDRIAGVEGQKGLAV